MLQAGQAESCESVRATHGRGADRAMQRRAYDTKRRRAASVMLGRHTRTAEKPPTAVELPPTAGGPAPTAGGQPPTAVERPSTAAGPRSGQPRSPPLPPLLLLFHPSSTQPPYSSGTSSTAADPMARPSPADSPQHPQRPPPAATASPEPSASPAATQAAPAPVPISAPALPPRHSLLRPDATAASPQPPASPPRPTLFCPGGTASSSRAQASSPQAPVLRSLGSLSIRGEPGDPSSAFYGVEMEEEPATRRQQQQQRQGQRGGSGRSEASNGCGWAVSPSGGQTAQAGGAHSEGQTPAEAGPCRTQETQPAAVRLGGAGERCGGARFGAEAEQPPRDRLMRAGASGPPMTRLQMEDALRQEADVIRRYEAEEAVRRRQQMEEDELCAREAEKVVRLRQRESDPPDAGGPAPTPEAHVWGAVEALAEAAREDSGGCPGPRHRPRGLSAEGVGVLEDVGGQGAQTLTQPASRCVWPAGRGDGAVSSWNAAPLEGRATGLRAEGGPGTRRAGGAQPPRHRGPSCGECGTCGGAQATRGGEAPPGDDAWEDSSGGAMPEDGQAAQGTQWPKGWDPAGQCDAQQMQFELAALNGRIARLRDMERAAPGRHLPVVQFLDGNQVLVLLGLPRDGEPGVGPVSVDRPQICSQLMEGGGGGLTLERPTTIGRGAPLPDQRDHCGKKRN